MSLFSCRIVRHAGHYQTADGIFKVWHEGRSGHENRWYVDHIAFDETLVLGGFQTKREAVAWLKRQYDEQPDYLFGDYTA